MSAIRHLSRRMPGLFVWVGILLLMGANLRAQRTLDVSLATAELGPAVITRVLPALAVDAATVRGAVEVEIVVDRDGRVVQPRLLTQLHPLVDASVLDAVRQWTFAPARNGRGTVATLLGVRVEFGAPSSPTDPGHVDAVLGVLPAEPLPERPIPVEAIRDEPRVDNPRLLRMVRPQYTAAAMRDRREGHVLLEAVVLPDGSVGWTTILKSLDGSDLDRQALIAARYWLFEPAKVDGKPVAKVVQINLRFAIGW